MAFYCRRPLARTLAAPRGLVRFTRATPLPARRPGGNEGRSRAPAFAIHRRLADHAAAGRVRHSAGTGTPAWPPRMRVERLADREPFFGMLEGSRPDAWCRQKPCQIHLRF